MNYKKLFTNWRVIVLFIFIVLSILAINPQFGTDGVAIRYVERNSSASTAGMQNPDPSTSPTARERVLAVNDQQVHNVADYYTAIKDYPPNRTITLTTTENTYRLVTQPRYSITEQGKIVANGTEDLGLSVYNTPSSNIKLGLDLSGGTRVILKPQEHVSEEDLNTIIDNIKERLNVFGLSDIIVRSAQDLAGEDFIIVEIAGANREEVQELLSHQGKFEAKIANSTVFRGGQDITYVCRSAECSGIDRNVGCSQTSTGWACGFSFQISLSPEAAARQAAATNNLTIGTVTGGNYLSEPIVLYLDDVEVDRLQIHADLKGRATTSIMISGSGVGPSQQAAVQDAITNMKKLQTVLITGSLPVQLDIIKTDSISPLLGQEFVSNAVLICIISMLVVSLVLILRYRKLIIAVPIIITMVAEVLLILGFAAWVGWNQDLAAIAAILITIGSGVYDQIIIMDETISGGITKNTSRSWKERISTAFFIIFANYFTLFAAMIPLWFAGAGLLRGFALTTIVGITAGVLITRPAFAVLVELFLKKEEE